MIIAILFGLAMFAGGVFLYLNHANFDLPYKYRWLFGNTKNAAIFIAVVGAAFSWVGVRRAFDGQAAIIMDEDGFMDKRYLRRPIPWSWITGHQMAETNLMGKDVEVLALFVQPGTKLDIDLNWNYKFNNWVKADDDNVVAFNLIALEEQDHYDLQNAFNFWVNRYPGHRQSSHAWGLAPSTPSAGFGRRVR